MQSTRRSRCLMPPKLDALQFKERIVSARVWLEPAVWHRHSQPNNVILARLSPLLHCHRGIGGMLVWDGCELPVFPLEDDGVLRPGLVIGLQDDIRVVRDRTAICSHDVQADRTATMLGSRSNKNELVGHAIRSR